MIYLGMSCLLSFVILILLYVIVLLNGRQYKYFKTLLEDERKERAEMFYYMNQVIDHYIPTNVQIDKIPQENSRVFKRSDKDELNLQQR